MKQLFLATLTALLLSASPHWAQGQAPTLDDYPASAVENNGDIAPEPPIPPQDDGILAAGDPVDSILMSIVSSGFPDIELHVTVADATGNPISGLKAEHFTLTEQSPTDTGPVLETITRFSEGGAHSAITLALVFDVSGSMDSENRLADAKLAAINFLNNAQAGDRASLVTFSGCDQGKIVVPVADVNKDDNQNQAPDINEAINALTTIGQTAVYDGVAMGVESIAAEAFPKGVIIFTDGESNNDCHYDQAGAIAKAREQGIAVYTIGLQSAMGESLAAIASETGGYYREAPTAADMEGLYNDISRTIRGQYTIGYTTHNPAMDGTIRNVRLLQGLQTGTGTYTAPETPNPNAPVILHDPVTQWRENQDIPITASISDPDPGDGVSGAKVFYGIPETDGTVASYTGLDMTIAPDGTSGGAFTAIIPANAVTPMGVRYYLTATDNQGRTSENGAPDAPHVIMVSATPPPPTASAGPDQSAAEGAAVTLDGSGSKAYTQDGGLTFAWRQLSGGAFVTLASPTDPRPVFSAAPVGPAGDALTFELTVTDSENRTALDTVTVFINDAIAPKAAFSWSPATPKAGQTVQFTDGSIPQGGQIVSWEWDFGGQGDSTLQNPEFIFTDSGVYDIRLITKDQFGSTGATTLSLTIAKAACEGGDCGDGSGCFVQTAGH